MKFTICEIKVGVENWSGSFDEDCDDDNHYYDHVSVLGYDLKSLRIEI